MSYQANIQRVASSWLLFDVCECCRKEYHPADMLGFCDECSGRATLVDDEEAGRVTVQLSTLDMPFYDEVEWLDESDLVRDEVAA